jgi:hypothetical protein
LLIIRRTRENFFPGAVPREGYQKGKTWDQLPGIGAPRVCDQLGDCHYLLRSADEEDILRALTRNGLERSTGAWGNNGEFRTRACNPKVAEAISLSPIELQELTRFCGVVR